MIIKIVFMVIALRLLRGLHRWRIAWVLSIAVISWALAPVVWCALASNGDTSDLAGAAVALCAGGVVVAYGYLVYRRQRASFDRFADSGQRPVGLKRRVDQPE